MAKQFPQGCELGEEWRDDDEIGLYKPSDTPATLDGSLNKKKTFQSLREKLHNLIVATGILTVSGDGITSSSASIDLKKPTTIQGMTGDIKGRIEQNSTDIGSLQSQITANDGEISSLQSQITSNDGEISTLNSRVNQGVKDTDSPTFAGLTLNGAFLPTVTPAQGEIDAVDIGVNYYLPRGHVNFVLQGIGSATGSGVAGVRVFYSMPGQPSVLLAEVKTPSGGGSVNTKIYKPEGYYSTGDNISVQYIKSDAASLTTKKIIYYLH